MDEMLSGGHIRVVCLSATLDALTLAGDIPTVAIIAPDTYEESYANSEDTMSARAFPFEENTPMWLSESKRPSPGAADALHLTWSSLKLLSVVR